MLIYPAIDLQDGVCVRLAQGRFDDATRYGDPRGQLKAFADAGAQWVHIVDLDGAKQGSPAQYELIGELARSVDVRIQSGGGVREREHVQDLLDAGIARVVVGSAAVKRPQDVRAWIEAFGIEHICCAFDVKQREDGAFEVVVGGWTVGGGATIEQALALYPSGALKHILVTDVSRDGILTGPNVELMRTIIAARPDLAVQASGGVATLDDLATLRRTNAAGAIIGRALYERRFTLEDALAG
ncbi:MAG: 1-(5-phosphoribosyl)-5-[(5-phosphoribosylamino)methylideneamino]imidazole-4-carboxamide isomerase [Hyphomonadaceae bacterium JAD_PAG50586_4]|nr:MAG: 1-(5-phosphoribosyl)-5-[(5-phosphoribosylamino)methylideneamino]imidazole-4-carboxamide isomerase [Hyphomonadaceae bacterium JAD_PAG50586_4]